LTMFPSFDTAFGLLKTNGDRGVSVNDCNVRSS